MINKFISRLNNEQKPSEILLTFSPH